MNTIQLELPLFEPPSYEQLCRIRHIETVAVVISRRLRRSWRVQRHRFGDKRTLTIPASLEHAPVEVKDALLNWAQLPLQPRDQALKLLKKACEQQVFTYLQGVSEARKVHRKQHDQSLYPTRGTVYDLREVFDSLNRRYFEGRLHSIVRWGALASKLSYQMNRRCEHQGEISLITIAGCYDHPDVPRYAIEGIMYHEMLHIAIPPRRSATRRVVHSPEFHRAERAFEHFHQWRTWERECVHHCIRSIKARARTRRRTSFC